MDLETLSRINSATEIAIKNVSILPYKRDIYFTLEKHLKGKNCIGFYGLRGVGKTTILKMLLEKISEKSKCAYVNCEAAYLLKYSLDEILQSLTREGFQYVFIDEIHEKTHWENAILTAFDESSIKIFFTGSSALAIETGKNKGDLTRKVTFFQIPPVSFREFLIFREKAQKIIPSLSFKRILSDPRKEALVFIEFEKYYGDYLKTGGVMYDSSDHRKFTEQVLAGIKRSMEKDLNIFKGLGISEQNNALSILYILARSNSYEVTKENLSKELGISWRETQMLLDALEKIGLIMFVSACGKEGERKGTGKLYLPIPLRSVLANDKSFTPDIGAFREEFFVQHAANCTEIKNICYPKGQKRLPDFLVNGKYFEIGGRNKGKGQKADYYILETKEASSTVVPLFLMGFLY